MDLIIKPTELCNFACTFCSSPNLASDHKVKLSLSNIKRFFQRFPNTQNIIVNGGDPLMMKPSYYFQILDLCEEFDMPTKVSLTTNLWDFYKQPDKWIELFRHSRISVGTSFNYGDGRRISKNRLYTEDDFWRVSNLFYEKIGYRPGFISVINDENEHFAIKCVQLAKEMGVECKLNPAVASGREGTPYQLSKMYNLYLKIYELNLAEWEFNTKQMFRSLNQMHTVCPRSRECDSGIRCLQPDGDYYSCGSMADDKEYSIDFEEEMEAIQLQTPLSQDPELISMKSDCFQCQMFNLCNGCRKHIKDMKRFNKVESHCELMKSLESQLLNISKTKEGLSISKGNYFGPITL